MREVLESALASDVASRVMFDALAGRAMPKDGDDVLAFVRGALRVRLVAHLGAAQADELVGQLDAMLARHAATGSFVDVEVDVDALADGEPSVTRAMAIKFRAPVPVLVAAGSDRLATLLEAALGPACVVTTVAGDAAALRRRSFADSPLLALIDGEDPPAATPDELAGALAAMPDGVVRVAWAADAPALAPVLRALDRRGTYVVRLERKDGVEPLLDLVRSRRSRGPTGDR